MWINRLTQSVGIALMVAVSSFAVTYYVSPMVSAGGTGTLDSPFKTIAQARDAAKSVTTDDVTIYLRSGWYVQTSTLAFDATHSGSGTHKIIYQAYPGEYPVISGGRQITGWTKVGSTNIWSASAPSGISNRQLYVNCVRAVRAHKGGPVPGWSGSGTSFTTTDNTMQNWGNKSDIEVMFVSASQDWSEKRARVSNISGTTITMAASVSAPPTDIENAYELLDQPGEWYLNRSTNVMYYMPRTGEDMSAAIVIAPVLDGTLVSLIGSATNKVKNIQFKGITFAHASYMSVSNGTGFQDMQANHSGGGTALLPGAVSLQYTNAIRFERCVFKHLSAWGLDMYNGSTNNAVVGCVFTEISGTCINIGLNTDRMRTNLAQRDTCDTVMNCYIHDSPTEYRGGCGISAGYVSKLFLNHNEIGYTPYTGISIGWGWDTTRTCSAGNETSFNNIHHSVQVLRDGGGIYTLSNQYFSTIHSNWLHNMVNAKNVVNSCHVIYTDQGTRWYNIYNNLISSLGPEIKWYSNGGGDKTFPITLHDNYTETSAYDNNGNWVTVGTNPKITAGSWPQAATDIMNNSGIQSAFSDVKNIQCACSRVSPTGSTHNIGHISSLGKSMETGITINRTNVHVTVAQTGLHNLTVVNMLGKTIYSSQGNGQKEYLVPRQLFGQGLYIVKLKTAKTVLIKKVTVN